MEFFSDIIGLIGVSLILIAYFLLERASLRPHQLSYLFLNLFGAILVIISLFYTWNLPAFVIEAAWAAISIYGIFKALRKKGKA